MKKHRRNAPKLSHVSLAPVLMYIEIRLATEADAEQLAALRRQLFAESNAMLFEPEEFIALAEDEKLRIRAIAR